MATPKKFLEDSPVEHFIGKCAYHNGTLVYSPESVNAKTIWSYCIRYTRNDTKEVLVTPIKPIILD